MHFYRNFAFATVSLLALSAPAFAGDLSMTDSGKAGVNDTQSSDIIVSARRKEERLQDVPKVVAVVSAADLQKNAIVKFEDIQSLTPGLTLQNSNNGLVQNTELRGVAFDVNSGENSTVAYYWNDGGAQANYIFQSMYDIGQIEVLKGPQGTLRGAAAPSGSVTITTRAPDLYHIGGTFEGGVGSDFYGNNEKLALNVPIIEGKLAVRIAGLLDDNQGSGVTSAYPTLFPQDPYHRTWSERISVRFEPTDNLQFNLVYQRAVVHDLSYEQTQSTCLFDATVSCANPNNGSGYAGIISAGQRLSTVSEPRTIQSQFDMFNARADWHILGQKLSYVGQYAISHLNANNPYDQAGIYNALYPLGVTDYEHTPVRNQYETNEIRLSSEDRIAGIFDYTLGLYSMDTPTNVHIDNNPQIIPAAYYPAVSTPIPTPPFNGASVLQLVGQANCTLLTAVYQCTGDPVLQYSDRKEKAIFGNIAAHLLDDKLEVSGGLRYLNDKNYASFYGFSSAALLNSIGGAANASDSKVIWTAAASYHITPDVLAYVNAGSSFRQGLNSVGPVALTLQYGGISPYLTQNYANVKNETSKSYEVGFKTQFLDHRGIFNIAYYHQDFTNFQYSAPDFVWVKANNGTAVAVNGFLASVPAKVDGVEIDGSFRFTKELSAGASFAYANGRITGGAIPCNGPNGAADALAAPNGIYTCAGGPASFVPRWNLALHGEYSHAVTSTMDGYLRLQGTITPASVYNPGSPYDLQKAYGILNTYLGVKSADGMWDLAFFVKNVTNTTTALATYGGNLPTNTALPSALGGGQLGSAYSMTSVTPPRQIGLTLRVSYGSH